MRLDRAIVARGLARSRTLAQSLIAAGSVAVDGVVAVRASAEVGDHQSISLDESADAYVSRGAHKLVGALDHFARGGLEVGGRACLDAGASTGGFTQVLLERGARHVLALDVGHGQLDPRIGGDSRVTSREGVNVRHLTAPNDDERVDVLVADLSFISLTLVAAPMAEWIRDGGDAVVLIKPQFEVGAERLGRGGIVRSPINREMAVHNVVAAFRACGLDAVDVVASPVSGERGNVEIFMWAHKTWQAGGSAGPGMWPAILDDASLKRAIAREVKGRP